VRTPDRQIAALPVHRVDPDRPGRTACGQPVAQTVPESWGDVPVGSRCPQCNEPG
jgi:hypothetical protein